MNTDFYYEIGHSHTICEDYALSGQFDLGVAFAIVCDGCSSSDNVDVGARVLAHSAQKGLKYVGKAFECVKASNLFLPIIKESDKVIQSLEVNPYCLDSTLLAAIADDKTVKFYVFGDGFVVVKKKDGKTEFAQIEFPSGAPYYCSYFLNDIRLSKYESEFGTKAKLTFYELQDGVAQFENSIDFSNYDDFYDKISEALCDKWKLSDIESVSLSSDGIATYEKKLENSIEQTPMGMTISMATNYKGFSGHFVERRMKRMKKDLDKDQVSHFDDISVSSIYFGEI